jgi:hypothetical protein
MSDAEEGILLFSHSKKRVCEPEVLQPIEDIVQREFKGVKRRPERRVSMGEYSRLAVSGDDVVEEARLLYETRSKEAICNGSVKDPLLTIVRPSCRLSVRARRHRPNRTRSNRNKRAQKSI